MNVVKMKAVVCTAYGSPEVLKIKKIERPTPKNNEVLIKIKYASVTTADSMIRKGSPYIGRLFMGFNKPKYPVTGTGFAGEIMNIGKDVTLYKIGDEVFGESLFGAGSNAEYLCVSEDGVIEKKPENMSLEALASVCDGPLTSINFLRNLAKIKAGQNVLIIGASGALGTAAVQLAKHYGATVTGVCSTPNVEMVHSLGADKVIDYKMTDFTKNGKTYDIIYDTVGKSSFSKAKDSLTSKGIYLSPVLDFFLLLQVIKTSIFGTKKAMFDATGIRPVSELRILLQELKELLEKGKLKTVIDKRYSLEQIAEAHRYVDTGRKKGNVVISL